MSAHQQVYKMFRELCEKIDDERLRPLGEKLMIGGNIPQNATIPTELKPHIKENKSCHQALREAIVDVTIERIQKERES